MKRLLWITVLALCAASLSAAWRQPGWLFIAGQAIGQPLGSALSIMQDVDGDGKSDIFAGAAEPGNGNPVWLFSGGDGRTIRFIEAPIFGIYTPQTFGESLSGSKESSLPLLVVGATNLHSQFPRPPSSTYVYHGITGQLLWSRNNPPDDHLYGSTKSSFGEEVTTLKDVDDDGISEIVVSSPDYDGPYDDGTYDGDTHGKVYVYSGATGQLLWSVVGKVDDWGSEFLGFSIADAGDVDGDGYHDVVAGTLWGASAADVYSGRTGSLIWRFRGAFGSLFGGKVSGAGDVDDDGHADILVSDWNEAGPLGPKQGRVYVFSGRTSEILWSRFGENQNHSFGRNLSVAGDFDQDGTPDVVVGNLALTEPTKKKVYLFQGRTGTLIKAWSGNPSELFGYSFSGGGNIDGINGDDVVIGAPFAYDTTWPYIVGRIHPRRSGN